MTILVAVYGSLKKEFHNHSLLMNSEFIGEHITEPNFTMVDLGAFPAVLNKGTTAIHGEIYRVTEKSLSELDTLEGYPKYYDRIKILTDAGSAWMYILAKESAAYPIIELGEWNPEF